MGFSNCGSYIFSCRRCSRHRHLVWGVVAMEVMEMIGPKAFADYMHMQGHGLDCNPYKKGTKEYEDYAFRMHELQVNELREEMKDAG